MWRTIASIIAGLVAWGVIATLLNFGLRLWLPGYVEAEPVLAFTLVMKIARLSLAGISCLAAGAVVRAIAPESRCTCNCGTSFPSGITSHSWSPSRHWWRSAPRSGRLSGRPHRRSVVPFNSRRELTAYLQFRIRAP